MVIFFPGWARKGKKWGVDVGNELFGNFDGNICTCMLLSCVIMTREKTKFFCPFSRLVCSGCCLALAVARFCKNAPLVLLPVLEPKSVVLALALGFYAGACFTVEGCCCRCRRSLSYLEVKSSFSPRLHVGGVPLPDSWRFLRGPRNVSIRHRFFRSE